MREPRLRCVASEVIADLYGDADEAVCPECGQTVHVAGTPARRYAIHPEPMSVGDAIQRWAAS